MLIARPSATLGRFPQPHLLSQLTAPFGLFWLASASTGGCPSATIPTELVSKLPTVLDSPPLLADDRDRRTCWSALVVDRDDDHQGRGSRTAGSQVTVGLVTLLAVRLVSPASSPSRPMDEELARRRTGGRTAKWPQAGRPSRIARPVSARRADFVSANRRRRRSAATRRTKRCQRHDGLRFFGDPLSNLQCLSTTASTGFRRP